MPTKAVARSRARLARSTRTYGPQATETLTARRDFTAEKLAAFVERTVADSPPLTDEQRHRIAQLLAPHVVVEVGS